MKTTKSVHCEVTISGSNSVFKGQRIMNPTHPISDKASPLALKIAESIFKSGDEPNDPCKRIAFKGGQWPDHETDNGGLALEPLAKNIERTLKPELDLLNRVAEGADALFKAELAAYGVVTASNNLHSALAALKSFREGGK